MDAIGLRPRIEEMADRIASWDYVVIVPILFYRSGSATDLMSKADLMIPANREAFFGEAMVRVTGLSSDQAKADAEVYIHTLLSPPGVSGDEIGVTGYCMGGRHSFVPACLFPQAVAAAGAFHTGGVVSDAEDSPHTLAANASAELYFGHADNDRPIRDGAKANSPRSGHSP